MAIEHLLPPIKEFVEVACRLHAAGNDEAAIGEIRKLRNALMEADLGDVPPAWSDTAKPALQPPTPPPTCLEFAEHAASRAHKASDFFTDGDDEHGIHELDLLAGELNAALSGMQPQPQPTPPTKIGDGDPH